MSVRFIKAQEVRDTVKRLCIEANTVLRPDVLDAIKDLHKKEKQGSVSKDMLEILVKNAEMAASKKAAICQDTGMVTVFVDMGRHVIVDDENIEKAINMGIEDAYSEGYFRKSVVEDPLLRKNTGTNTPGVVHFRITDGDRLRISVMPKGFGSENKSRSMMFDPTVRQEEIVDFCVETVKMAGPDACPPYVLGIGMGGTMEECALLAKKALLRPINEKSRKPHIAELEEKIKEKVQALKIGVMGLGGKSTVLGVSIEDYPTHIAGLPVVVNVCCHALRSATAEI